MNPAPGFKQYPQHRVETREAVELHEATGKGKKTVAPVVGTVRLIDAGTPETASDMPRSKVRRWPCGRHTFKPDACARVVISTDRALRR